MLAHHPALFLPPIKEIKFLAHDQIGYHGTWWELLRNRHWAARTERQGLVENLREVLRGREPRSTARWLARFFLHRRDLDWYLSLFPEDRVGGDISPCYYLLDREEVGRIHDVLPDLRILILLRSPLEQIWSDCRMVVLQLDKRESIKGFARQVETTTRMRRTYRSLIDDWTHFFGDRVFVGYLEDMASDPVAFLDGVTSFLGVEDAHAWLEGRKKAAATRANVGLDREVPPEIKDMLAEHAAIRLQGFEEFDPGRAETWRQELEKFEASGVL